MHLEFEVRQDQLCDFCKSHHDSDMKGCEGNACDKMRDLYLDHQGITWSSDRLSKFGNVRIGDIIYKIIDNKLSEVGVSGLEFFKDKCRITLTDKALAITVPVDKRVFRGEGSYYLNEIEAIKAYEELINKRISEMYNNLNSFKVKSLTP